MMSAVMTSLVFQYNNIIYKNYHSINITHEFDRYKIRQCIDILYAKCALLPQHICVQIYADLCYYTHEAAGMETCSMLKRK